MGLFDNFGNRIKDSFTRAIDRRVNREIDKAADKVADKVVPSVDDISDGLKRRKSADNDDE